MAAELEKLAKELRVEGYPEGARLLSGMVRLLKREGYIPISLTAKVEILREEMSISLEEKMRAVLSKLPDKTPIEFLYRWTPKREYEYEVPDTWKDFKQGLKPEEKIMVSRALSAVGRTKETVGQARNMSSADISGRWGSGTVTARFILNTFRQIEPESKEE